MIQWDWEMGTDRPDYFPPHGTVLGRLWSRPAKSNDSNRRSLCRPSPPNVLRSSYTFLCNELIWILLGRTNINRLVCITVSQVVCHCSRPLSSAKSFCASRGVCLQSLFFRFSDVFNCHILCLLVFLLFVFLCLSHFISFSVISFYLSVYLCLCLGLCLGLSALPLSLSLFFSASVCVFASSSLRLRTSLFPSLRAY